MIHGSRFALLQLLFGLGILLFFMFLDSRPKHGYNILHCFDMRLVNKLLSLQISSCYCHLLVVKR
jgi:hypothetical protein